MVFNLLDAADGRRRRIAGLAFLDGPRLGDKIDADRDHHRAQKHRHEPAFGNEKNDNNDAPRHHPNRGNLCPQGNNTVLMPRSNGLTEFRVGPQPLLKPLRTLGKRPQGNEEKHRRRQAGNKNSDETEADAEPPEGEQPPSGETIIQP